jgi:hypothetical protein
MSAFDFLFIIALEKNFSIHFSLFRMYFLISFPFFKQKMRNRQ